VSAAAEWHELEETYHYVTTYAPELLSASYTEARGARVQAHVPQAAQHTTGEVLPRGGDQKSEERKSTGNFPVDRVQSVRARSVGVSDRTQRKLDKIARTHPELLDQIKDGKLSVHRACIQAGHIKEVTPLQKVSKVSTARRLSALALANPPRSCSLFTAHAAAIASSSVPCWMTTWTCLRSSD
jgi:hypothetical protein